MKKVTLLLASLMASGMASAVQLNGSGLIPLTAPNCDILLNEDVRINLTSGVVAGATCTAVRVALATCHTAGRQASRSANVRTCDTYDDPDTPDNEEVNCREVSTPVTGPAMAGATSARGTVTSSYPSGACTAITAETQAGTL
ncbi:hypothetical protein EQ836_11670 [Ectopseudomonas mendocina]|uniref:Uncharacterized protein n=1 Tax=Ectopseudomonas mendocina TaxID=300 RepID=A0ABD7RX98_ECTME|nr:hypothetical protein [Pseudomonas mendocina]QTN44195.1 hypothetical protein H7683_14430 [Pseudomonas mendocina]TRO15120.1 hypothetical protein EQ829_07280 [Pseudomonas mendocina]TRO18220.1 hypothetical protein EQ836_11670 [Pseudomonas mendocina]